MQLENEIPLNFNAERIQYTTLADQYFSQTNISKSDKKKKTDDKDKDAKKDVKDKDKKKADDKDKDKKKDDKKGDATGDSKPSEAPKPAPETKSAETPIAAVTRLLKQPNANIEDSQVKSLLEQLVVRADTKKEQIGSITTALTSLETALRE